jgi:hypothetical protein
MAMRSARCTQADIARAIRALKQEKAAGAVEITVDGTLRIIVSQALTPETATARPPLAIRKPRVL